MSESAETAPAPRSLLIGYVFMGALVSLALTLIAYVWFSNAKINDLDELAVSIVAQAGTKESGRTCSNC